MLAPYKAALLVCLIPCLGAGADWAVARNGRFEVYAQDGEAAARTALQWFEQLRATVMQETGLDTSGHTAVRVIGFRSENDYARYRPSPAADAFYLGEGDRDYIVMPSLSEGGFAVAAHEYSHLVQHAAESHLPPWLSEGLADLFSTVRIDKRGSRIGGEVPGRLNVLRRNRWMPLAQLLSLPEHSPLREERTTSEVFYAQSWALAEMLALSPAYRPHFGALMTALSGGAASAAAMQSTYGKPLDTLANDLEGWVSGRRSKPIALTTPDVNMGTVTVAQAPAFAVQLMMAELLLAAGNLNDAESVYREVATATPEVAEVWAGLGAVAAARKQFDEARVLWKRALDQGLRDAAICFRYAELLDAPDERRPALERALALKPDYDDARWVLALLEENAGHFESALAQLEEVREVMPSRAYVYWCAKADVLTGLGRGTEARTAAERAREFAVTGEERAHAAQLAYIAQTHLAVRLARDTAGNPQMVTTRVPNDATWFNPFIEPEDDLRRVSGKLREVECPATGTRILVETAEGKLTLNIPDTTRVQMRNAPAEFVCGPQSGEAVVVEYAAAGGIVRGLEFR